MTLEHLPEFKEALHRFKGMDPIIFGNLHVDLDNDQILRSQRMAELLTEYGIIDLVRHLQQRRRFWDVKTWTEVRQGSVLRLR